MARTKTDPEEPVFEYPAYVVHTAVEVSYCDRNGAEVRFKFPAGTGRPTSEDEWFVLEHKLAPSGVAERVKEK